jgi:hypothetical protein
VGSHVIGAFDPSCTTSALMKWVNFTKSAKMKPGYFLTVDGIDRFLLERIKRKTQNDATNRTTVFSRVLS